MAKKYQREIEDILKQVGEAAPRRSSVSLPVLVWRSAVRPLRGRSAPFSPGRLMLAGVVFLLATLLFRTFLPWVVAPLAVAGVVLFVVGYGMFFVRPRSRHEKRWRGQVIEDDDPPIWSRFRPKR